MKLNKGPILEKNNWDKLTLLEREQCQIHGEAILQKLIVAEIISTEMAQEPMVIQEIEKELSQLLFSHRGAVMATWLDSDMPVRSPQEIQVAHDMMAAVILGEVDVEAKPEELRAMAIQEDVLCWMLRHDHNKKFEKNLLNLNQIFNDKGIACQSKP